MQLWSAKDVVSLRFMSDSCTRMIPGVGENDTQPGPLQHAPGVHLDFNSQGLFMSAFRLHLVNPFTIAISASEL